MLTEVKRVKANQELLCAAVLTITNDLIRLRTVTHIVVLASFFEIASFSGGRGSALREAEHTPFSSLFVKQ